MTHAQAWAFHKVSPGMVLCSHSLAFALEVMPCSYPLFPVESMERIWMRPGARLGELTPALVMLCTELISDSTESGYPD